MKKYSKLQLALLVLKIINKNFDSQEKIHSKFHKHISEKLKSIYRQQLTEGEIETKSLKIENDIFENIDRISIVMVINLLSKEVVYRSRFEGIRLEEYIEHFNDVAERAIKRVLQSKFKLLKTLHEKKKNDLRRKYTRFST